MSAPAQRSTPASTAPVRSAAEIRALVRRQKVDQRATLDIYFRTAEHVYVQVRGANEARRSREGRSRIGRHRHDRSAHAAASVRARARARSESNEITITVTLTTGPRVVASRARETSTRRLKGYVLTALVLGRESQVKVYRIEGNIPQLYRLLYAYVSVVLDTMAEHADWNDQRYAERVRREKKRVEEALLELEALQPVINAEAEAWRRSTPAGRPPPVARADRAENGPDGGLGGVERGIERIALAERKAMSTTTSTVNGEVVSKHSMYETKLPTVSQTSDGARNAAAHPTGRVTTPLVDRDKSANRGIVPPVKSSSGEARHAHSLLPPPPPAPPALGGYESNFSQSILYNAASVDFEPKVIVQVPTTDEAATDHTRLDTRLKLYNLQEKVVRGDGNCQFRAVADQLFRDQERHAECRNVVINQLRRSSEDYAPYVPEDFDDYVRAMREDAAWGDHVTLQAAADAYGVRMCVISSYKDNFLVEIQPKVQRSSRVCWISFWAEVHYNSVYPM